MTVMVSNQHNRLWHYWAGRYGHLGHLYSPDGWERPARWLPYALDNGAYSCYTHGRPFDTQGYRALLDKAADSEQAPIWALVPDVVADRDGTLRSWDTWHGVVAEYGWPMAIAVQDGMTADDVPTEADVIFVGGSTDWKLRTMEGWCREFPRVHVARVNTRRRLWAAHDYGAESIDGTGWYHERQARDLEAYLQYASGMQSRPLDAGMALYDACHPRGEGGW